MKIWVKYVELCMAYYETFQFIFGLKDDIEFLQEPEKDVTPHLVWDRLSERKKDD